MSSQQTSKDTIKQQTQAVPQAPPETPTQQPKAPQDLSKDCCNQQAPGSQESKPADRAKPEFKAPQATPNKNATLHLQSKAEKETKAV